MTASTIYKTVAVLLVLYAAGHTLGFAHVDPAWGVDAPIAALRTTTFTAQGISGRTFWGFYYGFGIFCSVLLLFSAAIAWQLGAVPASTLRNMQLASWSFVLAFAATTVVTWRWFFTAPVVFSAMITAGLVAAAALARRG
ncbi:MAG TPA: hypothetical protein VG916_13395 [Gemmatimonadaceae bacterium]|nr:hypothetical protein [Gemmatimonadaceae bacterium]